MGMKLFDDVGNDEDVEKIEIDQEFAKRYEHNKKREDMQKFEVMKKKGEIGSSSESESESESVDDVDVDGLFKGLKKIRDKDPTLMQKDAKLFESSDEDDDEDDDDEDDGESVKQSKPKPTYLKDLNALNVIIEGAESDEEDDDEEEDKIVEKKMKSFVEEQEDLRREVLAAIAAEEKGGESGGDLLIEKVRDDGEKDDEDITQKLDEFFGEDEKLNENDMFLKEFFKNKLWIDKGKGNVGESNEDFGLSEDEDLIEKQEEYERDYNFRFEESKSDRVLGHSRIVEGSVRKETNARKQQRDRKKERMELAELARREEVKRLKNLKRREIQEKLDKIREIAGVDEEGIPLNEDDLEKDFDPDEFDLKMKKAFGEGYYEAEDVDPEFGNVGGDGGDGGENENESDLEKPDFDKEDELLGLPKNWDVIKSKDGFLAKRGERKKGKEVIVEEEEEEEEEEGKVGEGKRKKKRKSKLGEALKKELEEELYKYDYEDAIGDLKTRFKYRKVKPDRYKLSAAEILWLDEQELNQYVSLKKLATYRENEWKVPQMRKNMLLQGALNLQKEKKRKIDGEGPSDMANRGKSEQKKRKIEGEGPSDMANSGKSQEGEENNEETKLSRNARRRKNKQEKSLPPSRRSAYGITSGSKKSKS